MTALPATPGQALAPDRDGGPPLPLRSAILGLGSHVPEDVLSNADLEALVDTSDRWILERTGVRERRRVGSGETASTLGAIAARRALADAGNPQVDAILFATSSPDTLFPSSACLAQRELGLGGIMAMDVAAACSGFVYALSLADAMIRVGTARTVLVIAGEAMTTLIDYKDRGTCVLFGDGAGAAVVGAAQPGGGGILATRTGADGGDADLIYYGPVEGQSDDDAAVRMAGRGTFRVAVERMTETAQKLCADAGWTTGDIRMVFPHQANLRIVEAVAKRLDVGMERVYFNGDQYGNTSAASIPIALDEAYRRGLLHAGDRLLFIAFGAGTTWGGAALEWSLDGPP
ncbi:MAG TPA: beta-ketoacyl-ACP synthase III [Candidatus Dormibacteraeota bacterium]|jgi:3-oxoacyl-[acyl-carrier-protein] synthase-3|nr:beta-ketoacyl-ACP synthase III [Candidatus Dormibacteraeota bacterium]